MWSIKTTLKCKECNVSFTDKEHLERHKKNVHK
ncbi:MAG: hypothetical protein HZA82_06075 [Thaumarchaeota archaeon]|nr:hypothetical protein [Nitrososphaerota archaeon]